ASDLGTQQRRVERLNAIGRADRQHALLWRGWLAAQDGFIPPRTQARPPAVFEAEPAHFDQHGAEQAHVAAGEEAAADAAISTGSADAADARARANRVDLVEEDHRRAVFLGGLAR